MSAPALRGVTLVLGGARSGKSRFAEELIEAAGLDRVYVATASAYDEEMRDRISEHRARRNGWRTVEAQHDLAGALASQTAPDRAVLVDCLTLWLSNVLLAELDAPLEIERLLGALRAAAGPVVLVSNEVGFGIVPDNALARAFRDQQGRLNQRVAGLSDRVTLVAAGLPLDLKLPKEPQ
ncbi:bifunctional adenosylcobinamide kinase/adenosylcobinamide-phosphate guanylyltransferase [Hansschlegelia sp.]|uniref:bifunctional adenosylcobinamide kinase/adenosylcobinamide-phosphate guanylyltransferase n=1 Tax=Hansschlegelia sp. TaxID=2041892 RepID=UPI002C54929B|nr:bifunctional adenosylcobinamide kinase/adenosylcobinamide-phosphate guanylyltransferase [Hansschlegelia sp.]HVI29050.1 bifunctional adenosylcobinamide kinase/adenosylcobinamide-phosphate guanylyltransferase [Hansschlegelia sp.]